MTTITAKEIIDSIRQYAPNAVTLCPDRVYDRPAKDWFLRGEFYKWFQKHAWDLGLTVYMDEINDCDDMAAQFRLGAQILNSKRVWKDRLKKLFGRVPQPNPLAVGEIWYTKMGGVKHACNAVFTDEQVLVFIEPQSMKEIHLSKFELESIRFARF